MVSGGHNKKTIEELKTTGSYRRHSREHQEREDVERKGFEFCTRPKPQRKYCGAPKKWIRNESDRIAVEAGCWFDHAQGKYVCNWIEKYCTVTEGELAGEPFKLLAWQRDLLMRLFGWMRYEESRERVVRRFNRCFCFIPKKNGKTPFAAALGLYMLFGDSTSFGQNVFIAATDKRQGAIAGQHAIRMIKQHEQLVYGMQINEQKQALRAYYSATNSALETVPSDPNRLEGLNGVCLIMDELHAWKSDRAYNALKFFHVSRPEPITFTITTAGDDLESVCRKDYDYAKSVSAGTIRDDKFLSVIYEAPSGSKWDDEKTWKAANPSLGKILSLSEMKASAAESRQSLRKQAVFRRYRTNEWVTGSNPWLDPDRWADCLAPFDERSLEGASCWAALDLAKTRDTTALSLLFPDTENDCYRQLVYFWLPEAIASARAHLASYYDWSQDGTLELTPGDVCDYDLIFDRVVELSSRYRILGFGFDPYNAESVTQRVEAELGIERIAYGQSIANIHPAASEYERRVLERSMLHNGNRLLTWQAGHVMLDPRYAQKNLSKPIKPSGTAGDYRTIDGIVSSVMALGLAITHKPKRSRRDLYEKRGIRTI